jgi:hypothetical protein
MEVSPTYGEAWNGRMRCTTGTDQADQEHEAMVENFLLYRRNIGIKTEAPAGLRGGATC